MPLQDLELSLLAILAAAETGEWDRLPTLQAKLDDSLVRLQTLPFAAVDAADREKLTALQSLCTQLTTLCGERKTQIAPLLSGLSHRSPATEG